MMTKLIFFLFKFSSLIASLSLLFLDRLLRFWNFRFIFTLKLFKLFILQLSQMFIVVVQVSENFAFVLFLQCLVRLFSVLLKTLTNPKFALQLLNLRSILQFVLLITFGSADDLSFLFFVCILLNFNFLFEVEIDFVPMVILDFAGVGYLVVLHDDFNCWTDKEYLLSTGYWSSYLLRGKPFTTGSETLAFGLSWGMLRFKFWAPCIDDWDAFKLPFLPSYVVRRNVLAYLSD